MEGHIDLGTDDLEGAPVPRGSDIRSPACLECMGEAERAGRGQPCAIPLLAMPAIPTSSIFWADGNFTGSSRGRRADAQSRNSMPSYSRAGEHVAMKAAKMDAV